MPTTTEIQDMIASAAQLAGIDPQLALQVALRESGLNPNAQGVKGEVGVMQLLPSSFPGVNIWDTPTNISTGVNYLAQQIGRFGDVVAGVAAYNWGPTNLSRAIAQYGFDPRGADGSPAWLEHAPAGVFNYVSHIFSALPSQPATTQNATGNPPSPPPPSSNAALWVGIAVAALAVMSLFLSD